MTTDPRFTNLREAHAHLHDFGVSLSSLDLSRCRSAGEALETIASAEPDETGWIRGMRIAPESWADPTWPTAAELEDAARGTPCYARSLDIHSLAASATALRLAGIAAGTPDPDRGVIVRDNAGQPTGLLLESACQLVLDAAPDDAPHLRKSKLRLALERFAALGYVEAHDMLSRDWLGPLLREIDEEDGGLPVRVVLHPLLEDARAHMAARDAFENDRITTGGVKIFTDGALNSRTASMRAAFRGAAPGFEHGVALMTLDEIENALRTAESLGLPLVAHAIGDAAVGRVLDAIDRVAPAMPGQRIEHAQFVSEADVDRFSAMRVIASMQPCHLLTDIEPTRRLLPHCEDRAFPLRDLAESYRAAGLDPVDYLWFGSDAPVVPPLPEDNLQSAVHRRRIGMAPEEALAPGQAIDEDLAIACMCSRG